jgi:MFS family permease
MSIQPEVTKTRPEANVEESLYYKAFRNRAFVLLWSGETISTFGDAFFNIAVLWLVYTQSNSILQTAMIQVIWHLSDVLFGPLAGVLADRWDRKRIMVVTNVLAAAVVGTVATIMGIHGQVAPIIIFVTVFLLNSLTTFLAPARFSVMPTVVGRDLLATAAGLFSTAGQVAMLVGQALAGVLIAAVGAVWAVAVDAISFLLVALCIAGARIPTQLTQPTQPAASHEHKTLLHELVDGWRAIAAQPLVQALVWLSLLINVASFMGPLYPALVHQRLHGGAAMYGTLQAMGVVGGLVGGALVGTLERRVGAGPLLVAGWSLAGVCTLGIAMLTWLPLVAILSAALVFGMAVGGVSLGALMQGLIAEHYLGRVAGITRALSVVAIPFSTLAAGWLADVLGAAPVFAIGGVWVLGVTGLAWANPQLRTARITANVEAGS